MKTLEKQINDKIMEKRKEILENGGKLKGKQSKIVNAVLSEYDLSSYEVFNTIPFHVALKEKGTRQQMMENASIKAHQEAKRKNFITRVKGGQIEQDISNWIEKHHSNFEVRHSRSVVASESFYIYEKGSNIALIKLSLHNTFAQELEHGTPFLNLDNYTDIEELKKDIEKKLGA